MPELPEVQTIVSDLDKKLTGHILKGVWTDWPKSFHTSLKTLKKEIKEQKIKSVRRRAKNILIDLDQGKTLLIHLKMTGHLLYRDKNWKKQANKNHPLNDPYNQYIRTIFFLDRNKELAFSDLRRFGEIMLFRTTKENKIKRLKRLGPEPLDNKFTLVKFLKALENKKGRVKSVLLDQSVISGIGNIYADEILWEAKINPLTRVDELTSRKKRKLLLAIKKILKKAVKSRGTSVADYRDPSGKRGSYQNIRKVYQRKSKPCYRCYTPIQTTKINNRGTSFCPVCQRKN